MTIGGHPRAKGCNPEGFRPKTKSGGSPARARRAAIRGAIPVLLLTVAISCRNEKAAPPAHAAIVRPRDVSSPPPTDLTREPGVRPGLYPSVVLGDLTNPYAGNPEAAVEGRKLFVWYNCSGCHGGRAGGGMGPSLRDSLWLYGQDDTHVFSTIAEGRAAGMPAWGAKLPTQQIWELVSYIRTLGTPDEPDRVEPRERQGFKTPEGLEPAGAASFPADTAAGSAADTATESTHDTAADSLPDSTARPRT
jgi:cytochrome c oxidase cbb3-type subunit 3